MADRGSVTTETVLLAPAVLAVVMLIAAGGRVAMMQSDARVAADNAARAATLGSGSELGVIMAIGDNLPSDGFSRLSVARSRGHVGLDDSETVRIGLAVELRDLGLLGLRREMWVTASSTEVFDRYGDRS